MHSHERGVLYWRSCRQDLAIFTTRYVARVFYSSFLWLSLIVSAEAVCPDADAIKSSDDLAQSYFHQANLFRNSRVLKKHSPTQSKEVVSYVQIDNRFYSIFTLVDKDCTARFMKRTRQGD